MSENYKLTIMKELSIEQKAKRYDEAIEKLRNAFYDNNSRMCEEYRQAVVRIIEPIFPELKDKESEDERMIERIKKAVESYWSDEPLDEILGWLEKKCAQKSAEWTAEDEEIHRKCICAMRASACGFPEEEKFVEQVDNWFKSLKKRYTWKPSDEQMEALKSSTYCQNEQMSKVLFELYQDLKKLMEE